MIAQLYEALINHYNESPLPAWLEGFYLYRAPQGVTGNYATMRLISGQADHSMSDVMDKCVVQISIWSGESSPATALFIADQFDLWLSNVDLVLPGGSVIHTMRLTTPLLLPDDDQEWQVATDYSIWIQEG